MKTSTSSSKVFASLISICFLLGLIALIALCKNDPQIYPGLKDIGQAFFSNLIEKEVVLSFIYTFIRLIIVLLVSLILAFIISLLYYYKRITMAFIKPFLIIMKSAPLAAISIYIYIVVRGGSANSLRPMIVCFLVVLPIILEGCIGAIDHMDQAIINELSITQGPKWFKFVRIYLPLIIPEIVTTLLQTIGLGFKVIVMAEYLCQSKQSVGVLIYNAFNTFNMANLLAIVFEIVIIVAIGEFVIKKFEKNIRRRTSF